MLSSRWTFFVKYIHGPLMILIIGSVLGPVAFANDYRDSGGAPMPPVFRWIFLGAFAALCVGILRFAVRLKRVELRNGHLYVSNYLREWEIAPRDILSVRQNRWVNSRPIRVHLRYNIEGLGSRFVFIPRRRATFKFWREDPQVEELRRYAETVHEVPSRHT